MLRSTSIAALAAFAVSAVGLRASRADSPPGAGRIVVHATARSGAPIAGASVRVAPYPTRDNPHAEERHETTNAAGVATVDGIRGAAWVRVDAEGFAGADGSAGGSNAEAERMDVVLEPGAPFDGVVVDAASGRPVAGASVVVERRELGYRDWRERPYDLTRSDERGRFHVRGVPDGQVATARAEAPGYDPDETLVQSVGGKVTPNPAPIRLRAGGRLAGVVTDPAGRRVIGAEVYVLPSRAEGDAEANLSRHGVPDRWQQFRPAYRAETGDAGSFVVDGLPAGDEYFALALDTRARTSPPYFAPSAMARGIRLDSARGETRCDLALRAQSTLVVRLLDALGAPVADGGVYRSGSILEAVAPGVFRASGLAPGDATIRAEGASFVAQWVPVHLDPGGTTEIAVPVRPGVDVEGSVVDEQGRSVPGADVTLAPMLDEGTRSTPGAVRVRADGAGHFVARHLDARPHELEASRYLADDRPYFKTLAPVRVPAPASGVRLVVVRYGTASLLVKAPDGSPYAGEADVLDWKPGMERRRPHSDRVAKAGWFFWSGLLAGDHVLSVEAEGFAPIRRTVAVRLGEHLDLGEATLDPGVELRGRLVDALGAPVPKVRRPATQATGLFRWTHVALGTTRVHAEAPGFVDLDRDVEVRSGMDPVVLEMARGALVRVAVRDTAAGRPIATALRADPVDPLHPTLPEVGGEIDSRARTIWRLAPGRWRISRVVPHGDPVPLGEWDFAEGDVRDLEATLPAPVDPR